MKMDIFLWKKESARGNIRENATKRGQSKRKRTDLRRKTKGRCPKYRSVKSKWERWCWNRTAGIEKHKAITEKPKDKIKKQAYYTEKTKHNRARQIVFLPLPHSVQKIQADFLSKRPHFSRLPPLFLSKPPYPAQTPLHSYAQDTRLRVYTRPRTHRIFHFCLHPSPHPATSSRSIGWVWRQTLYSPSHSPQQSEIQHLARLPLQKIGEGKRVKPSHVTHNQSTPYHKKVKRWRQK